jgi:alpha-ketoglutarate-dependent taurine dioxygenase
VRRSYYFRLNAPHPNPLPARAGSGSKHRVKLPPAFPVALDFALARREGSGENLFMVEEVGDICVHEEESAVHFTNRRAFPGWPTRSNENPSEPQPTGKGFRKRDCCDDLPLHTDGTFETRPPGAMIMRERAVAEHLPRLPALVAEDCFTIRRDKKQASKPLFRQTPTGLQLFFRYDKGVDVRVKPECVDAFRDLASYGDALKFKFNLDRDSLLIFDNTRMLHGRGAFDRTSDRHIEGLWLDGRDGDPRVRFGIKRTLA